MTWYAYYETDTLRLHSLGTTLRDPVPDGFSVKAFGDTQPKGTWNTSTLDFDPFPLKRVYPIGKLIRRFTLPERIAFRTSTNENVRDLWFVLFAEDTIDVYDAAITQGLDYLEAQGILATGRADEIRGT